MHLVCACNVYTGNYGTSTEMIDFHEILQCVAWGVKSVLWKSSDLKAVF